MYEYAHSIRALHNQTRHKPNGRWRANNFPRAISIPHNASLEIRQRHRRLAPHFEHRKIFDMQSQRCERDSKGEICPNRCVQNNQSLVARWARARTAVHTYSISCIHTRHTCKLAQVQCLPGVQQWCALSDGDGAVEDPEKLRKSPGDFLRPERALRRHFSLRNVKFYSNFLKQLNWILFGLNFDSTLCTVCRFD